MKDINNRNILSPFLSIIIIVLILIISASSCEKLEPIKVIKVQTGTISNVLSTSCIAGGTILDVGEEGITQHGHCWSTMQNPTLNSNPTKLGPKNTTGDFSSSITGLSSNTTYYVKAYATNSQGTVYGKQEVSFKTAAPELPTATTNAATSVSMTTATLNGTVNANGQSTTVTFEYGTTTSYGSTATASQSPVTGSTNTNVSSNISSLTANTTYHFRVKAVSSAGTTYGSDQPFTTNALPLPTATTNAATSVSMTTATLNGTVNANGQSTTVTFEYGTTTSYGSTATASENPVTGSTNTNVSSNISSLAANTTYHFRVNAVSSAGTTYGLDQSFTTEALPLPTATTNAATNISMTTATLNGLVDANGQSTTVTFEYGTTTSYGSTATASQSPVTGSTNTNVSANISSLTANTTYHFRVNAVSTSGPAYGSDWTFTTSPNSVSDIEGNTYPVVKIGNQYWMAKNLEVKEYRDGTSIPEIMDNTQWDEATIGAWCQYNNNSSYEYEYGLLYNYFAISNPKGLCPSGWHIPSNTEWDELFNNYGGREVGGNALKETGTAHWYDGGGTNIDGFTALPGGMRSGSSGIFYNAPPGDLSPDGWFWSISTYNIANGYTFKLHDGQAEIIFAPESMESGCSVRCIKD